MATLQTFGGGTTDFILDPGNGAKPLPNAPYTVIDGVTMLPASGLTDANGIAVTQLTSDADGRYAGSALLEGSTYWLDCVGSRGPFRAGPQVSTTALAEVVAMGPQLNTIAASAAASAFSAKQAQAAAEAVQTGAATTDASKLTTGTVPPARLPDLSGTYASAAAVAGKVGKGDLVLNVKDYGAAGNGSADDTSAFTAAFAACDSRTGTTLLVPAATYVLTGGLVLPANTTIVAYGARVRSSSTGFVLRNYTDTDNAPGYTGRSNITILGGTWEYTGTGQPNFITFAHASNITVRDATFLNMRNSHAIELNSVNGGRVVNCNFTGYIFVDRDYAEAVQIDLPLNGTTNALPWDGTPCRDILVQGCRMGPSATQGPWGRGVGSHTATDGVWHENIRIVGNFIDGAILGGVRAYQWRNSVIEGNTIRNAPNGISVDTGAVVTGQNTGVNIVENVNVSNNVVTGSTSYGIRVTGLATAQTRRVVLSGNQVSNCGIGINLSQTAACEVLGGYSTDATGSNCLYIQDSSDASVVGLRCHTAASNVVNLSNSNGASLVGMRISGATNSTIAMTTSSDVQIRDCYLQSFTVQGFNISSTCNKVSIMGCVVRKGTGSGTVALSITATCNGVWYTNNDVRGLTISDSGTASIVGTNQLT